MARKRACVGWSAAFGRFSLPFYFFLGDLNPTFIYDLASANGYTATLAKRNIFKAKKCTSGEKYLRSSNWMSIKKTGCLSCCKIISLNRQYGKVTTTLTEAHHQNSASDLVRRSSPGRTNLPKKVIQARG
jgi:hypothetical protein